MNEETKVKCSRCGQTESVLKLSIVYGQSLLKPFKQSPDEPIEPPVRPDYNGIVEKYVRVNEKVIGATEKYAGCLTSLLVLFVSIGFPIITWIYIASRITWAIFGVSMDESNPVSAIFITTLFSLIIIPPVIALYIGLKRRKRFNQEHMPSWIKAMEEWSKKFYCSSCNHVFVHEIATTPDTVNIDWSGFQETDTQDRVAFENIHKTFLCIPRNEHCSICNKELNGFLFSNEDLKGLTNLNPDDYIGFECPTCGTYYCKKCKKKTLKIALVDGISQFICSGCLSPTPTLNALIWYKGWYKTIKVLKEARKKQPAV